MVEIPGYKIERELGRGGMATVYLAVQLSVERQVALKVMSPVLLVDPSFSERFIREAKIAAKLYHPHVVAVHDVGVHEEQPYIAMEYLAGADLSSRCGRGSVDVPFAIRVVREIASALHYAHEKGFVHRDVKPENILFREDDTAVLSDFGIARAVNSATQMTKTGAVIGTPQYMSPEQARGKELDGRSDLYGLGIVFYEMLTGRVPYEGSDSVSVGIKHVTDPVPKLPSRFEYVQPVLERFLAKHPDDRYQTGGEALIDLKELEARIVSGETPAPAAEPVSRSADQPTQVSGDFSPIPAAPQETSTSDGESGRQPIGVSATPRPDGKLRQEPTLGSLDDIGSFDRTVSQPQFKAPGRTPVTEGRSRRGLWSLVLLLLAATAAVGWWQRDALMALLPDPEVQRLLSRAQAAIEYEHWYGDTQQYANRLYSRVLELDPGNPRALAGLELIAQHFADEAERAYADGNASQARLLLGRAEELAPRQLPRLVELRVKFSGDSGPSPAPVPAGGDGTDRANTLLAEARQFMEAGKLVRPDDDNALSRFRAVLELDPGNQEAIRGMEAVEEVLVRRFRTLAESGSVSAAEDVLEELAPLLDAEQLGDLEDQLAEAELRRQAEAERRAAAQAEAARRERIEGLLSEARDHLAAGRLTRPEGDNALATYREVLAIDSDNQAARDGMTEVARRYLSLAEQALEADELNQAEAHIAVIASIRPALPGLQRARERLALYREQRTGPSLSPEQAQKLEQRIAAAQEALGRGDLMEPPGASAYDNFKAALSLDPDNEQVLEGMRTLSSELVAQARESLRAGQLLIARARFNDAQQADPFNPLLGPLKVELAAAMRAGVSEAIADHRITDAEKLFEQAALLEPDHEDLDRLQLQLSIARDSAG